MGTEARQMIEEAIESLVNQLHKFDAEINYLENLGYTSSTQYDALRCRLDGVEVFGKDNEEFGLWDKFAEEAPYEEAVEEAAPLTNEEKAQNLKDFGNQLMQSGDVQGALDAYNTSIALHPSHLTLNNRAQAKLNLKVSLHIDYIHGCEYKLISCGCLGL